MGTPFFFKLGHQYFKNSDQKLLSKKNKKVYCYLFRESTQLKYPYFLENLKYGIFKDHFEAFKKNEVTFLSLEDSFFKLTSLNTSLLTLKTYTFSRRFTSFVKKKKHHLITKFLTKKLL